jgi:F-type H+-transporting ATPase subunit b
MARKVDLHRIDLTLMKLARNSTVLLTMGAVIAAPSFAFAAEEAAASSGSWLGTMFFTINFVLFAWIIYYFAGPMASAFFRDRATGIRSQLERLTSALREAEDLANRAAQRMAHLEQDAAQLKSEMENETAFLVNRIQEGARTTAERIRHDTEMTGAAIVEAAQRRVRQRLAANAAHIARDLIAKSFEASDQARLIDNFMDKVRLEAAQ